MRPGIIIAVLPLLVLLPTMLPADSASHLKAANEFIALQGIEEEVRLQREETLAKIKSQLKRTRPADAEDAALTAAIKDVTTQIGELLSWKSLQPLYLEAVLATYEEDELIAINSLFSSPAGRTYIARQQDFNARLTELYRQQYTEAFNRLNQLTSRGPGKRVDTPPPLIETPQFLGSTATHSGDFEHTQGELSAGPGRIIGEALANGKPVQGLKLRLALNGSVMSEWAETDSTGEYRIKVPYGKYRIDGYELDRRSANKVLANKISDPGHRPYLHTASFTVAEGKAGSGINFVFVDPVIKIAPQGEISQSEDIIASWEPYPGADHYTLQIYENEDIHGYPGINRLFKWKDRPQTGKTSLNLSELGVHLKSGHYYTLKITAHEKSGRVLSESADRYGRKDFNVVE